MLNYEVLSDGNIVYTKGFEAEVGFEFEIELDNLTAKRLGTKAAKLWFDLLSEKIKDIEVYSGFTTELDSRPNREPLKEGEIRTLTKKKCVLQSSTTRNKTKFLKLLLETVR